MDTTPVRRPTGEAAPALPGPVETAQQVVDIDQSRDIGWVLIVAASSGVMLAAWMLFGLEADGMWAGYWASMLGSFALLGACLLRTTLPAAAGLALTGANGAGLILVGIVQGYSAIITIPLIAGGALIVAGTALTASSRH